MASVPDSAAVSFALSASKLMLNAMLPWKPLVNDVVTLFSGTTNATVGTFVSEKRKEALHTALVPEVLPAVYQGRVVAVYDLEDSGVEGVAVAVVMS